MTESLTVPATVSDEYLAYATGKPGRRHDALTRKSGDLPFECHASMLEREHSAAHESHILPWQNAGSFYVVTLLVCTWCTAPAECH